MLYPTLPMMPLDIISIDPPQVWIVSCNCNNSKVRKQLNSNSDGINIWWQFCYRPCSVAALQPPARLGSYLSFKAWSTLTLNSREHKKLHVRETNERLFKNLALLRSYISAAMPLLITSLFTLIWQNSAWDPASICNDWHEEFKRVHDWILLPQQIWQS